ncbi:PTPDL family protein [Haloferula sp. BvORR071]|uniref:PTPDL family protein n=1 Tax=Haloferula sp. BvORR071 TaxID=1396141 RepID=UPI00054ECD6E|nr:PTPDL family protein [Haloferula sp. BvORR071]
MKTRHLLPLVSLLLAASAPADTFELKDGSKIEGTIVKEDGSDYIIAVQVTKSIKDERRIPKADVVRQFAEQKDETAFAELAKILPTPDLQSEEAYQAQSAKAATFLKTHKDSARKKEVQKIYDTLESELAVVKAGGVKFGGKMISAEERAPKAYGLDASIVASNMKKAADRNDLISALREWSKLEKSFPGSKAYKENVPYAASLMKTQLANVTTSINAYPALVEKRKSGLSRMSASDRVRSEEAIAEEAAAYTARVEREKADGVKWLSLDPYFKPQLDDAKRNLDTESRRLSTLDTSTMPKTEEAYEDAYQAITKEGATKQEVDAAISKVRGVSMPEAYLQILTKATPAAPAK